MNSINALAVIIFNSTKVYPNFLQTSKFSNIQYLIIYSKNFIYNVPRFLICKCLFSSFLIINSSSLIVNFSAKYYFSFSMPLIITCVAIY